MPDTDPLAGLSHVELYTDHAGQWRWRLVAGNGETVIPPEGHRDAHDARRALGRATELLVECINAGMIRTEET